MDSIFSRFDRAPNETRSPTERNKENADPEFIARVDTMVNDIRKSITPESIDIQYMNNTMVLLTITKNGMKTQRTLHPDVESHNGDLVSDLKNFFHVEDA